MEKLKFDNVDSNWRNTVEKWQSEEKNSIWEGIDGEKMKIEF